MEVEIRISLGEHEVKVAFETHYPEDAGIITAKVIKSLVKELKLESRDLDHYALPVGEKFFDE